MDFQAEPLDLEGLRNGIDALNGQILELLVQRGRLVCCIGKLARTGQAPRDHDAVREAWMLETLCQRNPGPYSDEDIKAIFGIIFERSLELKKRSAE